MRSKKAVFRKRTIGLLILLLASFITPVINTLLPQAVDAAGETYSWEGYQTIRVSGGNIRSTTLVKNSASLPGRENFNGGYIVTSADDCQLTIQLTLSSNSSGTILASNPPVLTSPDKPVNVCSNDVVRDWNNRTVSISGTRPGVEETEETTRDKSVSIRINSPESAAASSSRLTFTVEGNGINRTITLSRHNGGGSVGVYYTGSTTLDPGAYTGCASAYIDCVTITKQKFQPLSLNYGEAFSGRSINVTVQIKHLGGAMQTVPTIPVNLQRPDGSIVQSASTEPLDVTQTDTGLAGAQNIQNTYFARTAFENVEAGDYQVCITSINQCKDVTKVSGRSSEVTFEITGEQAQTLLGNNIDDDSCESESGVLGWIICPILDLFDKGIEALDNQVESLLETKTEPFETGGGLHQAWATVRNLAYLILVPIMLVMVIGTALGFDFISAYTVKRALPRLVIAAIFISLSWEITTFLIEVTNAVGKGVLGIMTTPFEDTIPTSLADVFNDSGIALGFGAILGFAAAVKIFGGALVGILMLYAAGAFLGLLVGFFLLALRQLLIIVLVMLSGLAILSWIFPGNDKLWKLWWNSFSKLLFVFPIIMVLIGAGRIFAGLSSQYQKGALGVLLAVTAYIAPYFLIPATFKLAGGMFATITGMAQDRERGLFDRLRKGRQELASQRHQENMAGTSALGKGRFGSAYRRAASLGRNGSWSPTRSGRSRWTEQERKVAEQSADKLLEVGGARAFNDDDASAVLRQVGISRNDFVRQYMARGHSRGEAESALHRAELATGAKVGSRGMAVAAQKFRVAMTNTAYEPGEAGLTEMQRELMDIQQQGLATAYDVAGWMKANRGRADYSANGYNETVQFVTGRATAADQLAGAFRGADPRDIIGGHQRAVESFSQQAQVNLEVAVQNYNTAVASGDAAQISQAQRNLDIASADLAGIYDTLGHSSPRKAQEFADTVFGRGVQLDGEWTTVRAVMEQSRLRPAGPHGEQDFLDRRREYGTGREAMQAGISAEAAAPPPEEG